MMYKQEYRGQNTWEKMMILVFSSLVTADVDVTESGRSLDHSEI